MPAADARLKLSGERVAVVPAADGREVDAVALERAVAGRRGRRARLRRPGPDQGRRAAR